MIHCDTLYCSVSAVMPYMGPVSGAEGTMNNRWLLPVRVSDAYGRSLVSRQQRDHATVGRQMDTPEASLDTLDVL